VAEIKNYVGNVSVYLIWYLLLALCKFLKPSCPEPPERNCIALARIRVRKPDCRVLSICEISVREYVLSALLERFYGLIRSQLAEVLGRLCCDRRRAVADDILGRRIGEKISVFDNEARLQALAALKGQGAQAPGPGTFLERSVGNRERAADMETLVLGLLGAKDSSGKTFALAEELADPVSFMLSHQVWRPFIDAVLPESWNGALQLISKVGGREIASLATQVPATGLTKEVTDLRQTVTGLEKITSDQQKVIAELQRRIGRR
jgi:hypothetical protein